MADQLIQQGNTAVQNVQNPNAPIGTDPNAALFAAGGNNLTSQQNSTTPTTMTPNQAFNNTPIPVPTVTSPDPSSGITSGAQQTAQSLQDTITSLTPAPTAADNQNQSILDSIASLTGQDTGRAQAQIDAEKATGATQAAQELKDLNNQLLTANASYEQQFARLGGNGSVETQAVLNAQQAGLRRAQAADIGLIAARVQAKQGDLTLAQNTANRAVDAKYSVIEDQIKTKLAQLAALQPQLDKEQKLQALAQQKVLQDQATKLADEKAAAKENVNLALTAGITTKYVNKNGQFFDAATGQPFSDPAAFFKAAGVTSFEQAYKQGLVTDFSLAKIEDQEFVSQLAAKYPDAGIKLSDDSDTAQSKLKNSRIYQKDTYIAPVIRATPAPQKGSLAATDIVDASTDAQVKALIASKPGDGGYGAAYKAVSDRYGKAVADAYDKVYQGVFNGGQSVDAAFNNAKLGSNGIDSTGGLGDYDILAEAVSNKIGSVASKNSFLSQYKKATTDEQKIKILASNVVLPTEVKNGIIQNTQVTKSLEDVLSMLDRGVQTGLLQAAQSYVANKTGTGGDKEIEAIKSKLVTAVQPYRNKVTGAAWGDQEEAEYQALIGSVKFSPDDLRNKLNVFKDTLKQQSQTALLAGIDPLGAVNSNSSIQNNSNLGGTSLSAQVAAKGYDYQKMRDDGNSDEEIKAALGL